MTASPAFWDRIARRYARSPVKDEAAYRRKLEISRRYFNPETTVLEIGCGTGSTALAHAPYVRSIVATDISSAMIDIAEAKREAAGITNVTFRQGDSMSLPPSDGGYDAVLALSLLHLVDDLDATLNAAAAVLKPGGVLISNTVCIRDKRTILPLVAGIGRRLGLLPHLLMFDSESLLAALTRAGFSVDHHWPLANGMTHFIVAIKRQ